jgi:hypothetical protein
MPYLDLPKDHRHFKALQRVGATGMLRGEGRNVGWSNQTWFRADDPLMTDDIFVSEMYSGSLPLPPGEVTAGTLLEVMRSLGFGIPADPSDWWMSLGLGEYDSRKAATRLQAAVVIDSLINPFFMFEVNLKGEVLNRF